MLALTFADVDDHALAVDVSDFQVQGFLTAQGRRCKAWPVERGV
jgi:hypothetical protein